MAKPLDSDRMLQAVRSKLERIIASSALVEIDLLDREASFVGFPVFMGEDYFVMTRLFQQSWENGFHAIRLERIGRVAEVDEEGALSASFVRIARLARGLPDGPRLPFKAKAFAEFLTMVCKHFPLVVMSGETQAGKAFDFAATVSSSNASLLHARLFEEDGTWQAKEQAIPISEIYEVLFDSEYERTLEAISKLADA